MKNSISKKNITVDYDKLFKTRIDLQGRDLIIGFNEPAFKKSKQSVLAPDLDSKLNARLPSYFIPAVQIARMQKRRPRLIIVSAVFAAAKWNAHSDTERKIMLANNNLKIDFLKNFFENFFPDVFSIIEFRYAYDFLKISDHKLDLLWNVFERKHPGRIKEVKKKLLQFIEPKLFIGKKIGNEDLEKLFLEFKEKMQDAFKYAIVHLFALGDVNIGWDFAHNSLGYCSIGEHNETIFNIVRNIGYEILSEVGEIVFDQEVFVFNNMKIVIEEPGRTPPPYNGAFRNFKDVQLLDEVTFENQKQLSYYNDRPRLKPQMEYLYKFLPKEKYENFWNSYQERYQSLKKRYQEAYDIKIS